LGFVADLALRGSDHVPLIQDDEADVIQHRRIGSKSEVQLLRCGDDNLAGAKRVLVDVADPHAAVERRDADAERREGPCEDLLRLSGQGSERGDIDRTSLLCEAHQDRQLGDAGLAGTGRQRDNEIPRVLEDPVDDVELGGPEIDLGTPPGQERLDEGAPEIAPPSDAITRPWRWFVRDVGLEAGVEQVPQQASG
jgi:hypothetical protein